MTAIKSVSMTEEEANFLEQYNLSPTQLLKEKIWEMKGAIKNLIGGKIEKMARLLDNTLSKYNALRQHAIENGIISEQDETWK